LSNTSTAPVVDVGHSVVPDVEPPANIAQSEFTPPPANVRPTDDANVDASNEQTTDITQVGKKKDQPLNVERRLLDLRKL
jgi:hypothetical protein